MLSKYPKPISLPQDVYSARIERNREVIKASRRGIIIRISIIIFEFIGVALFRSSALFMDALASLIDVFSTVFLIICIKLAARPPDLNHPFGHGRYEPLAGLQLGLFLALVGIGMVIQQSFHLVTVGSEKEVLDPRTWIFPFVAMIFLEGCYHFMMRTAKQQHSTALAADAFHYRIDGLTSLFATIALLIAAYLPLWSLMIDHIGAICIAILMILIGLYASRTNLNQLLDRVPEASFFETVREASLNVPGVKGTEKIRIQQYGPDAHVDIDIEVDPELSVEDAHKISQYVRVEIQKAWPMVQDVTVHIEPYYANDH